jgi:hypothetical protein
MQNITNDFDFNFPTEITESVGYANTNTFNFFNSVGEPFEYVFILNAPVEMPPLPVSRVRRRIFIID